MKHKLITPKELAEMQRSVYDAKMRGRDYTDSQTRGAVERLSDIATVLLNENAVLRKVAGISANPSAKKKQNQSQRIAGQD